MSIYYHIDRNGTLKEGAEIELESFNAEQLKLSIFSELCDEKFTEHLLQLAQKGLSKHGRLYLIDSERLQVQYQVYVIEMYFEYFRWKYHSDRPSRFQSFFVSPKAQYSAQFFYRNSAFKKKNAWK